MDDLFSSAHVPFVVGSDTSMEAAESIQEHATRLAMRVYHSIVLADRIGRTCWEIETATGLSHQTASARVRELALKKYVVDSGIRRKTGTGRNAVVWVAREGEANVCS